MKPDKLQGYKRYKQPSDESPLEFYDLITDLKGYLKNCNIISRVEYVGSGERGTWIANSDYDNLFVNRDESVVADHLNDLSPYAFLKRTDGTIIKATAAHAEFKEKVLEALEKLGYGNLTRVSNKGSSISINYYPGGHFVEANQLFSVDVHLCYEVQNAAGHYHWYIAMSPPGAEGLNAEVWRMTVDRAEESETERIGSVARWAVRIMKAIKKTEPSIYIIRSIVFEQTAYHLKDEHLDQSFWHEDNMKEIIKQMLLYVAAASREGYMKHYLMHQNILEGMDVTKGKVVAAKLEWLAMEPQLTRHMMYI